MTAPFRHRFRKVVACALSFLISAQPVLAQSDGFQFRVPLFPQNTGAAGGGTLAYSAMTANFGAVLVGQSSSNDITVTNSGTAAIAFSGIQVAGTGFSQSNTCGTYIVAGGSCVITTRFAPGTSGSVTGSVTVNSDDVVPTNVISLSGRGQAGTLTAAGYTFPGTTQVGETAPFYDIVVRNISTAPVDVSSVSVVAGASDFSQSNGCLGMIGPGGQCTVRVSFSPTAPGPRDATVALVSDSDDSPLGIALHGEGQAASGTLTIASFGAVQVGDTATQAATLTNTGVGRLHLTQATVSGTDYTLQSNLATKCGASLASGDNCTLDVRLLPTTPGAKPGQLTVESGAGVLTATLAGDARAAVASLTTPAFAEIEVGATTQATAVLTNDGVGTITVGQPMVTGTGFTLVTNHCAATLAPAATCNIDISYAPTTSGAAAGQLNVPSQAGTKTVTLGGNATQAVLTLSQPSAAFGNVQVNATADSAQVTLRNTGTAPANGLNIAPPAGYALQNSTCPTTLPVGGSCTFKVQFQPTQAKAYPGNVNITSTAPTQAVSLSLSGTGQAQSMTLSDIAFGNVPANTLRTGTATIQNTGVGPVSVTPLSASAVTGTGFAYSGSDCPASLPAGATCTVTVSLTPTNNSAYSGTLTVVTSARTAAAALTGQGQQGTGTPSPTALTFVTTQVGQSTTAQTVTISNSGNYPLTVTGVSVLDMPSDFGQTNTCATPVAAGGSCQVFVSFTPTQSGPRAARVVLAHNGPAGLTSINVSGTGANQSATLSAVDFGNLAVGNNNTLNATLTNTGVGPLSVTVPTSSSVSGADFSFSAPTTCTTSLAVGSSCVVPVRFTPSAPATRSGTLSFATGAGTMTSNLSGVSQQAALSLSPATIAGFGTVQVGQTVDSAQVTLSNSGNVSATSLSLQPPAGYSLVNSTCGTSLNAGSSCTFNVRFAPAAVQSYPGSVAVTAAAPSTAPSLTVAGSGAAQAATISNVDFNGRAANTTAVLAATLTNTGVGPLSITAPTAGSVAGAGFTFQASGTTCGTTLAAGSSCVVNVQFAPTNNSAYSGSLTLSTGAGNKVSTLSGQGLQGTGIASTSGLTFVTTQVGQTATTQDVTVTNNGNTPLTVSGVSISSGASDYAQSNNCGSSIPTGGNCKVTVAFTPAGTSTRPGTLSMVHNGPGGVTNVSLTGQGQAQSGTLSGVSFGSTQVSSTTTGYATLTNTGIGPLSLTAPSSGSVTGTGFNYTTSGTTCGTSVGVGSSCVVGVQFTPSSNSNFSGNVSLNTGAGTMNGALSGSGQQAILSLAYPGHTPGSSTVTWGNVQVGQTAGSATFTVSNSGNIAANSLNVNAPSGWYLSGSNCPGSLGAGSSCTFSAVFAPSSATGYSGQLTATTSSGTSAVPFAFAGTGVNQSATFTSSLPYGNRAVGSSTGLSATLTNNGVGPLTVTSGSVSGTDFAYAGSNCPNPLPAGQSCSFTANFNPSARASRTGTLYANTGAGQFSSGLTGTGVQGVAGLSTSQVNFSAQNVGTTAGTQTVTLTNNGDNTLTVSGLSVSVNSAEFGMSNTCGSPVAPGGSCYIYVNFTPNGTGSRPTGAVSIAHNGSGASSFTMTGTGVGPASASASFSPTTVTAGSQSTFTWSTSGASSVNVSCGAPASGSYSGSAVNGSITVNTTAVGAGSCTVTPYNSLNTAGSSASANISAVSAPSVTGAGFDASYVSVGYGRTFSWSTSGASSATVSCGNGLSGSGSGTSGSITVTGSSPGAGSCTVSASNGVGGTASGGAGITVVALPSVTGISYSPSTVTNGQNTTVYWNTANASSVGVSCNAPAYGSYNGSATSGGITVSTSGTGAGRCYVTASNLAGQSSTSYADVSVVAPASVQGAGYTYFSPATVTSGNQAAFYWSTSGATSASVSCSGTAAGSGSGTSGGFWVNTSGTGAGYCTVTAYNAAGTSTTGSATLNVVAPAQVTSAYFNTSAVNAGSSAVFTWATNNATSASVSCSGAGANAQGNGVSGSINVGTSSSGTTRCDVTAFNAAGNAYYGSANLTVNNATPATSVSTTSMTVTLKKYDLGCWWQDDYGVYGYVMCPYSGSGTMTVTNSGGGALAVSTPPRPEQSVDVGISGCNGSLSAGQSCTITVSVDGTWQENQQPAGLYYFNISTSTGTTRVTVTVR